MLPISLTALWWGFMTNVAGQTLLLLLVLALLAFEERPELPRALLLLVAATLAILSHVGVLIQLVAMLGLLFLFSLGRTSTPRLGIALVPQASHGARRLAWVLPVAAAAALVSLLYLSVVLLPMLGEARSVFAGRKAIDAAKLAHDRAYIVGIMPTALARGLTGVVPLLALWGLPLLLRTATPLGRRTLIAWLLTPLFFFAVDVAFILQVRYIYFAAPLCCLAAAAILARLPGRTGRAIALVVASSVFLAGSILWLNGAIFAIKASLIPLTH
jgi:toxin CptA